MDQLRLKLTQSPTGVGVKVGTELGNKIGVQIFLSQRILFFIKKKFSWNFFVQFQFLVNKNFGPKDFCGKKKRYGEKKV